MIRFVNIQKLTDALINEIRLKFKPTKGKKKLENLIMFSQKNSYLFSYFLIK